MFIIRAILCISVYFWICSAIEARILCVDANTTVTQHDGSCWDYPFKHLQDALDGAALDTEVKEIWVAKGIYRPTKTYAPSNEQRRPIMGGALSLKQYNPGITFTQQLVHYENNKEKYQRLLKTFSLVDGIDIYGGFKGNEQSRAERTDNFRQYQTILEGHFGDYAVWHVVSAGNDLTRKGINVTLDRLVIRHGNACNGPYFPRHFPLNPSQIPIYYHDDGGGLYIFIQSKITLNHIIFENNQAIAGGAIYVQDGSVLNLNQCEFRHNEAQNGAAINIRHGGPSELMPRANRVTTVNMRACKFVHNTSQRGRAVFTNDNQQTFHHP